MSLIKFEITEDHLKLIKHLKFNLSLTGEDIISGDDDSTPFGGTNLYEDIGLILYGKPDNFNPLSDDDIKYTDDQKKYMSKLLRELPEVLDIILYTTDFTTGNYIGKYKTKYHLRDWKKITKDEAKKILN